MNLAKDLKTNSPASKTVQNEAVHLWGSLLPEDLVDFYKESNGAEGPVGDQGYIQLWPLEILEKRNNALQVAKNLPNTLIFASNGGSFYYGYSPNYGYFMVDPISWKDDLFEGGTTLAELFTKIGNGSLIRITTQQM